MSRLHGWRPFLVDPGFHSPACPQPRNMDRLPRWRCVQVSAGSYRSPSYATPREAAIAADALAFKLFGPEAHLNVGLSLQQQEALCAMTIDGVVAYLKKCGSKGIGGLGQRGG